MSGSYLVKSLLEFLEADQYMRNHRLSRSCPHGVWTMSDWRGISTAPPPALKPLLLDLWVIDPGGDGFRVTGAWRADAGWWVEGFFGRKAAYPWTHRATHWLRPQPPEADA